MATTFNLTLPGELMTSDLSYRVILTAPTVDDAGDEILDEWPTVGAEEMNAVSNGGSLDLVLVPIQYDADGSGRTPITDETTKQTLIDYFYIMYPVSRDDINITVTAPLPWNNTVERDGTGWTELLLGVAQFRQTNGASDTEYYYGLIMPDDTFSGYCRWSCTSGMGYVPISAGQGYAKVAVGLGFESLSTVYTMLHEVGHNHGIFHAPCGNPSSPEPDYPYENGSIGVFGYDLSADTVLAPSNYTDIMSYCYPKWISDYTYGRILDWMQDTHAELFVMGVPSTWRAIAVTPTGDLVNGGSYTLKIPPAGEHIEVVFYDATGIPLETATGYFTPHSTLAGGQVLFPEPPVHATYVGIGASNAMLRLY
jgi:hypothetical protein